LHKKSANWFDWRKRKEWNYWTKSNVSKFKRLL